MGRTPSPIAWRQLWAARAVLVAALAALLLASKVIDPALQLAWTWLREQPWYNSPFFETLQVPVVSFALYLGFNAVAAAWPEFDMRDESDQRAHGALAHQGRAVKEASWDFFSYVLPLLVLDSCTRKFYPGWVSRADWQSEPYFGWQTTRLLPEAGPTVFDLLFKPVAALLFYDAVFYFLHNAFHRVSALKEVHSVHHEHVKLSWTTTNQLTVVERVSLVLLANEALKLVQAHPLSRNVFVVLFLFALAEGHCNLDLPWGVDKLCPLYTGARAHVTHHDRFACNFAPFFAHMDALFGTSSQCVQPCVLFQRGDDCARDLGFKPPRSWFWDDLLGLPMAQQQLRRRD
ncbi:hypothetical protein FNF29_03085 [Cafeteria roenbergensis]|uniref:Fatty acid hydroxylase domain-containing protein n=1 Tax=Cafeteria roenbergensis TaxID=33653 RepID=A0A5A8CMF2_CAFRO|nr:hypothetical protein FNF29_03085 [Cafeteria roenbergensis]|eukprot:KAA0153697.1 hypothetical protein FNF29_03085 [Cafeteria roenbergensis]